MSSIPFERYDDEFQTLTSQIQASLRDDDIDFTSSLLSQCDDLLKQMAVEARGADDANVKRDLLAQVRQCKLSLSSLRDEFKAKKALQERAHLSLSMHQNHSHNSSESKNASKERLLQSQNQLEQQNETLDRARRIMADTEEVGMEITSELARNRETLETAHGRVREVSGLTNRARRLLQNMNRRAVQQKLALYTIAVVIVLVIGIILWNIK
jgi:vesicle transport through interaction with t-SNAREs 1